MINYEEVKQEVLRRTKPNMLSSEGITILVVSLILFFGSGLIEHSITKIIMIIVVLIVHEAGHYLGMMFFNYKDIKMFFIPFLGAAVSGHETNPSNTKKAIVSLMGPLPGIFIALILILIYRQNESKQLLELANLFLFINCFNLLPLHPLDGGRLFEYILFSRNRNFELVFKIITTILLAVLSVKLNTYILMGFSVAILLNLKNDRVTTTISHNLKNDVPDDLKNSSSTIPDEYLERIVSDLNHANLSSHLQQPKKVAPLVELVWNKTCSKPATVKASLGILAVFIFSWCLVGLSFIIQANPNSPEYIANYKKNFIESCVGKTPDKLDLCTCVYEELHLLGITKLNITEQHAYIKTAKTQEIVNNCSKRPKKVDTYNK